MGSSGGKERTRRLLGGACLLLALALTLACTERRLPSGGGYVGGTGKVASKPVPHPETDKPPSEKEPSKDTAQKGTAPKDTPTLADRAEEEPVKYGELTKVWGLGTLSDLGPAAPATATTNGVYFVTRSDELLLAKRTGKDGFIPLEADPALFARYGRGPAISKTHAYWVSERDLLLRAPLRGGAPEVLFEQARIGTRTSVVTVSGRDVVTFIAEIDEQPYAYVWASKGTDKTEILRLTPEGANATSAALVEGDPHPRAIVLSGRLGMSPVHVRRIRTTPRRLTLEQDEVVWIAPGSHVLTEIHALTRKGNDTVAFLPTAKDFNDFGLAQLEIGDDSSAIDAPSWQIFPNGLDPAPVAAANFCGNSYLLYARPTEARPRAPQELHLVEIKRGAPEEGEVVARSRAFSDLSLAPTKGGAVVTWTADRRTWGMVLSCPAS